MVFNTSFRRAAPGNLLNIVSQMWILALLATGQVFALATRGFGDAEFTEVADIIALALQPGADIPALRDRVAHLAESFPLYPGL